MDKTSKVLFCIHFTFTNLMLGRIGTFRSSSCRGHSFPFGNTILDRWKFQLYQMTEFMTRMSFLEFILFDTSLYLSICFFIIYIKFLKGIEFFLVTSGHVVETDLVQFVVYWLMYIIIGKQVWPGYNLVL
jgi:hypothetical protein